MPRLRWLIPRAVRPFASLAGYRRGYIPRDLVAGLTVAAVLVPQAMAYALLAGLPPEVGLYAATLPLIAYAVLGTSRHVSVGPVALISLVTFSVLSSVVEEGSADYIAAAATLAVMAGVIQLVLSLARLGFLVNFISHSVLVGFTAGAALIIAASQAKNLAGVSVPSDAGFIETVITLGRQIGEIHWPTLTLGGLLLAGLVVVRRRAPRFPSALSAAIVATIAVVMLDLDSRGVKVVGDIPAALPAPSLPSFDGDLVVSLLPGAFLIAGIAYLETIAIGKAYARREGYSLRPNQEMAAVGVASVTSGLVGGYPVSGSFSRTAENAFAGARSQVSSVATASVVILTLAFLTPLLANMPAAALAALIIVAVAGLVDLAEIRRLARVKRGDFVTVIAAFVATLALGVELGLLAAVGVSFLVAAGRGMWPRAAELGWVPGTRDYRDVTRFPEVETYPEVVVMRFEASLTFVNAIWLRRRLSGLVRARDPQALRAAVIDASGINNIDASAEAQLAELVADYGASGVAVHLTGTTDRVRETLVRSGLWQRLGERTHPNLADAVTQALADAGTSPVPAPLQPPR